MTLEGQDLDWYNNMPQNIIYSFEQLANLFLEYFSIKMRKRSSIIELNKIS